MEGQEGEQKWFRTSKGSTGGVKTYCETAEEGTEDPKRLTDKGGQAQGGESCTETGKEAKEVEDATWSLELCESVTDTDCFLEDLRFLSPPDADLLEALPFELDSLSSTDLSFRPRFFGEDFVSTCWESIAGDMEGRITTEPVVTATDTERLEDLDVFERLTPKEAISEADNVSSSMMIWSSLIGE